MKKFFALIGMQLRDKVDLSWTHSAKEIIKKIAKDRNVNKNEIYMQFTKREED